MIKKFPDESSAFKTIKTFLLGVAFTIVIMGFVWMKNHYKAIVMAVTYPEVVETLKINKTFEVKK